MSCRSNSPGVTQMLSDNGAARLAESIGPITVSPSRISNNQKPIGVEVDSVNQVGTVSRDDDLPGDGCFLQSIHQRSSGSGVQSGFRLLDTNQPNRGGFRR